MIMQIYCDVWPAKRLRSQEQHLNVNLGNRNQKKQKEITQRIHVSWGSAQQMMRQLLLYVRKSCSVTSLQKKLENHETRRAGKPILSGK